MIFKSTKSYYNMPCSHQQWKDADQSGIPGTGECAKTHGYSREVHFEFTATEVDEYGWVVGFGALKPVKDWLTWLFDHTSLWEASDPRLEKVIEFNKTLDFPVNNIRVLPFGVSMEQSSFFIALFVVPFILKETNNRCWVSKIEVRENDKNSAILELTKEDAFKIQDYFSREIKDHLSRKEIYEYIPPHDIIRQIFG